MSRTLVPNLGAPMLAGPGGSVANATASVGNSLAALFAPGAGNVGPEAPILDPFAGQLHSRFEVPDTASTVNLGDAVVYMMMSDGEDFYTRDICPIVEWGWAIKRFTHGTWVFPQYAVHPTPETAPPRYVESYMFNETTSLTRYATGHHMSVEYMNTTRGHQNQLCTLKQLAYNIQETQNLCVINALMNCRRRIAERREMIGSYTLVDLEEEFKNEVSRFCRVQKEEFGFLTMWEEILREMARLGGRADSVIITKRVNSLVVTRPEYTKYMEAGPSGPATVRDPNRSFLPAGVNAYFSNTYPERFGAKMGPWQQWLQIGTYAQSKELSVLNSRSDDYFKNYDSKTRSVWLYDLNVDKFVEVDVKKMIQNCGLFDSTGKLRLPDSGKGFSPAYGDKPIRDFLTMDETSIWSGDSWLRNPFDSKNFGPSSNINNSSGNGGSRSGGGSSIMDQLNAGRNNRMRNGGGTGRKGDGIYPIGLVGHLQENYFGVENFQDCGAMIIHRIADMNGCSAQGLVSAIQQGLSLYADMSRRPIDRDFIDFVIRNAVLDMYKSEKNIKQPKWDDESHLYTKSPFFEGSKYVDLDAQDPQEIWQNIKEYCLQQSEPTDSSKQKQPLNILKNVFEHNLCLPLPYAELLGDKFHDKSFSNLTGYQSFPGFCEMAKLYKLGSQIAYLQKRYNMKELEIASNFVDAMEMFAQGLESILPECVLFTEKPESNGYHTRQNALSATRKAKLICEKVFNMGGSNIWINLRKHDLFLLDSETAVIDATSSGSSNHHGKGRELSLGEWYEKVCHELIKKNLGKLPKELGERLSQLLELFNQTTWEVIIDDFMKSDGSKKIPSIGSKLPLMEPSWLKNKSNLRKMVDGWIKPKINNPSFIDGIVTHDFEVGSDDLGSIKTLSDLYKGVGLKAPHLSAENSWLGTNCIILSGPLRLFVLKQALRAVGYGLEHINNPIHFLELLCDLNLLMAPNNTKVFNTLKSPSMPKTQSDTYSESILPSIVPFRKKLHELWPDERDEVHSMKKYGKILKNIYERYFSGMKEVIEDFNDELEQAIRNEGTHEDKIMDLSEGTEKMEYGLYFPILDAIFKTQTEPHKPVVTFIPEDLTGMEFLKKFVVPISHLLHIDDIPSTLLIDDVPSQLLSESDVTHDVTQMMTMEGRLRQNKKKTAPSAARSQRSKSEDDRATIGPRQRRQRTMHAHYMNDPDSGSSNFSGGLVEFIKTSLVFSAEQIQQLKMVGINTSTDHIEITSTDPGNYSKYVSPDKINTLVSEVEKVNHEISFSEDPNHIPHWRTIPLLFVDRKLKHTFFGPPMNVGGSISVNSCGLPVSDVYNKSFTQTCFSLDRIKCPAAVKMATLLYMSTAVNMNTLLALAAANIRIPMNFILARPHRNFITESCAILSTGIEKLGFTAMACRDYITGQTVLTKEWNGHVSFMANTIITHPENCYIQQNIMVTGFGTGQGVRFWDNPQNYGPGDQCGSEKPDPNWPSMFCFAVPFTEVVDRNYINTPGRVPHLVEGIQSTQIKVSEETRRARHYSTADRYNKLWGFHKTTDSRLMSIMGANGANPLYNTQCYQDTCGYWDPYHKTVKYMTLGTGHLGKNVGPGFKDVMEGRVVRFKDYGYECNPSITIV